MLLTILSCNNDDNQADPTGILINDITISNIPQTNSDGENWDEGGTADLLLEVFIQNLNITYPAIKEADLNRSHIFNLSEQVSWNSEIIISLSDEDLDFNKYMDDVEILCDFTEAGSMTFNGDNGAQFQIDYSIVF